MHRLIPLMLILSWAVSSGCRGWAANPPPAAVTVVEATASAPNEAEKRAALRAADLVTRLLTESGLTVRRVTDDALAQAPPRDRVAILPYNPFPPPAMVENLEAHVRKGGRLIVFYSSSEPLARLLGFRLGPLKTPAYEGQWSAFSFDPSLAPALAPERVVQTSRILRPALPANPSARIIAWWEDRSGRPQDPAWALSGEGAWMSHVLQDGDRASRGRLLAGLAGHFDPRLLRSAADQAAHRGGASAPFPSFAALAAHLRARGAGEAADSLKKEQAALGDLVRKGRYAEAVEAEGRLAARAAAAVARTGKPVRGEFRAVWNSSGLGLDGSPGSWARTARLLADHGLYGVFPHAASAGAAQYPSRLLPQTEAGRQAGDPLGACVKAAQQAGLAVHAWLICWNLEGAPADLAARLKKEGRLQVNASGRTLNWLCPSRADNVERQLAILEEVARHYAVQGIHLDYIRYPDRTACYCTTCRAGFERAERLKVAQWPADALKSPLAERYTRWRADQITRFVRLAGERLREVRPSAVLSAAVYGWYPGCITTLGQDWGDWVKRDLVAFVCPMNYTDRASEFSGWLDRQLPLATGRARILPGIGVTSVSSRLNGLQTIEQIEAARRAGAPGFILYDLNNALEKDVLPLLRLGVTAE